jgi:hypothetical protein
MSVKKISKEPKQPSELSHRQLVDIVTSIQCYLYIDDGVDNNTGEFWDPNHEVDVCDFVDYLIDKLKEYDLCPTKTVPVKTVPVYKLVRE